MVESVSVNHERSFFSKRVMDACKVTAKRISKIAVPLILITTFSNIPMVAADKAEENLEECLEACVLGSLGMREYGKALCVAMCYSVYAFEKLFGK